MISLSLHKQFFSPATIVQMLGECRLKHCKTSKENDPEMSAFGVCEIRKAEKNRPTKTKLKLKALSAWLEFFSSGNREFFVRNLFHRHNGGTNWVPPLNPPDRISLWCSRVRFYSATMIWCREVLVSQTAVRSIVANLHKGWPLFDRKYMSDISVSDSNDIEISEQRQWNIAPLCFRELFLLRFTPEMYIHKKNDADYNICPQKCCSTVGENKYNYLLK